MHAGTDPKLLIATLRCRPALAALLCPAWLPKVMKSFLLLITGRSLQMIKGGHKTGKTGTHTIGSTTSTWYTELSAETVARELLQKETLEESDK